MDDDSHPGGPSAPPTPIRPLGLSQNRETHEFGHAMMDVVMAGERPALPDKANHAGYANASSGDSLAEGFSWFWTMFADETAR